MVMDAMNEISYAMVSDKGLPCRIKKGWENAGQEGHYFGKINIAERWWAIVTFDMMEYEPEFHKAESIEVGGLKYYPAEKDLPWDVG